MEDHGPREGKMKKSEAGDQVKQEPNWTQTTLGRPLGPCHIFPSWVLEDPTQECFFPEGSKGHPSTSLGFRV